MARWSDQLYGSDRDAGAALISLFESYDLGSLAPKIVGWLKRGYGAESIQLMIQETSEYKQRFKANETRLKNGLAALAPAEYLSVERGYRQALRAAGMPKGFYDSPEDFTAWLGGDVSPTEVAERSMKARELADSVDPLQRKALANMGVDTGDIAAYYLNTSRALPTLQKRVDVAMLSAESLRSGLGYNRGRAEELYSMGLNPDQARQGFSQVASLRDSTQTLGSIYGDRISTNELLDEAFEGDGSVTERRRRLASQERATFEGSAGTGQSTFTRDSRFD